MSMRNIRLTLAYDGTDFYGWQIQRSGRTVQGVVMNAIEKILATPVKLKAAGRTDAGVHATGQVANFYSSKDTIPAKKFRDALNSYLPSDVRVLSSCEVPHDFDARKSAKMRVYRYYIKNSDVVLPHHRRYCLRIREMLDIDTLNRLAAVLIGEHDFTAFAASGDANKSKKRNVVSSVFYPAGLFLVYKIAADSFLWKMVRSILGTILEMERRKADLKELAEILKSGNRKRVGQTVPPWGLFLDEVRYA